MVEKSSEILFSTSIVKLRELLHFELYPHSAAVVPWIVLSLK